jgi:hypothetical protein
VGEYAHPTGRFCRHTSLGAPVQLFALIVLLLTSASARAHPLSQGSLDIIVNPDTILVHARVTSEEVAVTNSSTGTNPLPGPWAAAGSSAFDQHAEYLAAHLHFSADGQALAGRVVKVTPPNDQSPTNSASAEYDLEYPLPVSSPKVITLRQDALADVRLPAGQSWATMYLVTISQAGHSAAQSLLSRSDSMSYVCQ